MHAGMLGPGLPPYVSQYGGSQTRTRLVCIEFCPPLFPEDDCDQSMQSVRRSSLYDTPWGRWTPCRTSESEAPSLLWLRHPPAIAALIRGPGANDWPCWRNIILCRLTDDVLSLVYFHVHTTTPTPPTSINHTYTRYITHIQVYAPPPQVPVIRPALGKRGSYWTILGAGRAGDPSQPPRTKWGSPCPLGATH